MVLSNAIKTSTYNPCWAAAEKTKYLLKNPTKGGIPASENNDSIITKLSRGLLRYSPL